MNFTVIVTVGPSLLEKAKLEKLDSMGDIIYRINGAHVGAEAFSQITDTLRKALPASKIMIDLPGNKVRLNSLPEPIRFAKGEPFELFSYQLNYPDVLQFMKPGMKILANDSIYSFDIADVSDDSVKLEPSTDGILHSNRGLHMQGVSSRLPFLFPHDMELIRQTRTAKADYISLSYVRNVDDIRAARKIITKEGDAEATIIPKIETASAVENLGSILGEVEMINVDRGDLSTEVGMLELPFVQERIFDNARRAGKPLFLATQFLKNMEIYPVPLIAEIMDLQKTIKEGLQGIQLSEETAIGRFPLECVELIYDVHRRCGL